MQQRTAHPHHVSNCSNKTCGHLYNDTVLSALSPEEHAMLVGRVGFLVLFNPLKPEGAIELDMSSWEQVQVLCILCSIQAILISC